MPRNALCCCDWCGLRTCIIDGRDGVFLVRDNRDVGGEGVIGG